MDSDDLQGLLTAIAIGLLIGVVRERQHHDGGPVAAGIRTHAMVATAAAVAAGLGPAGLVAGGIAGGGLAGAP